MSLHRTYGVWCDGGDENHDHAEGCPILVGNEWSSREARALARQRGWKRVKGDTWSTGRDLSPQCAEAGR